MQRHPDYTRTRVKQLAERMKLKIYAQTRAAEQVLISERVDRVGYDEAMKLKKWRAAKIGEQLGPLWATFWFRAKSIVPGEWAGKRVDLLWNTRSEATLWMNGRSIQGLNFSPVGSSFDQGTRPDAVLIDKAKGGESIEFEIEVACNGKFGDPLLGGSKEPGPISPFVFERCDLGLFDPEAWKLYFDFAVLVDLEAEVARGLDPSWAGELLAELNRFANIYDEADRKTWKSAAALLKPLYEQTNGSRAHELSAIGHAHIDTAWLWPLAETHRKCVRTFSSQTRYMQDYPQYKFACSQAYQYEVMKRENPDLYKRMLAAVKKGQWVPVGGTWIEPDCNIPSGESLIRQFLIGQRFFEKEFGRRCNEFWNPDVFGYNGQLPQIMRLAGISRFLTQKLSWNRFNKPPHHTFIWQGIDGSEVLAHFPPADTYNADASIKQLRHNVANYKDHDRSRHSYYLFGFGDGGGGPTKQMIEVLSRVSDLQGLPRVKIRSSDEFFELLENDLTDRPTMIGELYFEYHRGTYTSQARVKRENRKSEVLLHDLEFLAAVAEKDARPLSVKKGPGVFSYPSAEVERLWKLVLLNQFHDILPGSSIGLVYEDAKRQYEHVRTSAEALRDSALAALVGKSNGFAPVNTLGFPRHEVTTLPDGKLGFVDAPSYGIGALNGSPPDRVSLTQNGKRILLENAKLKATLNTAGRLVSLIEKSTGREAIDTSQGDANCFQLFDDQPTAWDAWDVDPFHLETKKDCGPARSFKIATNDPLRGEVSFEHTVGQSSTIRQTVRLDASSPRLEVHCEVDWAESHKFLKVSFPVNVRAMNATYEMQFGCVERPTHFNTSHDLARYEVPLHKWFDLSEHGFGVAILSECKYGGSVFGNCMRLSLLRAPKYPDPQADMGTHTFSYAVLPHAGDWRDAGVVAEGFRFNAPLQFAKGSASPRSFASVDDPNLVLDTIKKAEDSDAIVLRLYECHGGRGVARAKLDVPFKSARFCNALEGEQGEAKVVSGGAIEVPYTPFKVITLLVK